MELSAPVEAAGKLMRCRELTAAILIARSQGLSARAFLFELRLYTHCKALCTLPYLTHAQWEFVLPLVQVVYAAATFFRATGKGRRFFEESAVNSMSRNQLSRVYKGFKEGTSPMHVHARECFECALGKKSEAEECAEFESVLQEAAFIPQRWKGIFTYFVLALGDVLET